MDSPTVSVVITAYHRTRWLPAATSSVLLAQTDPPDEVLVVEEQGDGRRAYEETETRGVPVRRWNGAPAGESLERVGEMVAFGLREARSEIVSFLDDDDVYLPGKVAAVRGFFAAHPAASALKTYPLRIDAEGRLGGPLYPPPYRTERRVAPVLREA